MPDVTGDLVLVGGAGPSGGVVIPAAELLERFSRSSGPGGQSVNTADSRVELRFDVAASHGLTDDQKNRIVAGASGRLVDGVLIITASEHRSQLQNRAAARARLRAVLAAALGSPPPSRRASRPSRAARQRRIDAKKQRSSVKANRGRVRDY